MKGGYGKLQESILFTMVLTYDKKRNAPPYANSITTETILANNQIDRFSNGNQHWTQNCLA